MKQTFRYISGALALLVATLIGSIPFLVSLIAGVVFRRTWLAYLVGFTVTIALTLYFSAHPATLRFGSISIDLNSQGGLRIGGVSSWITNCGMNLLFAHLGVLTGSAARNGYYQTKANKMMQSPA